MPIKGYNSYINKKNIINDKLDICNTIAKLQKTGFYEKLKTEDKNIYDKILVSYQKHLKNISLENDDYLLEGHEINEFFLLEEKWIPRYLVYRYKYNIYPQLKIQSDYPPCVQIEPTSICNYRCIMCYQIDKSFSSKSQGFMGHMSLEIFKLAIDELHGKVEAVTLASRGEPTLNPNIKEMLNYCAGKFLALKLNTNASMLNEELCHTILQADIQNLIFSADAANKQEYETIRVNGKFDKVKKNIELFSKIRAKHYPKSKIITKISGVKINKNQSVSGLMSGWGEIVDEVALVHYTPWESSYENQINDIETPCSELWRRMFLWWDGKVNPCDYDYKSVLSSLEKKIFPHHSLKQIWSSDFYNELRIKHLNKNRNIIDPCKRCNSV